MLPSLYSVFFSPLLSCFFDFESPVLYGLDAYKSRLHLSKGPEGVALQAAQKEVVDARKKTKAEEARWKLEKEKEVTRRVKARKRRSDVESEDSIEVDDDFLRGGGNPGGRCDLSGVS